MKNILLFDFDGVIVDCLDTAFTLSNEIQPKKNKEEYLDMFMGNIYTVVEKSIPIDKREAQHKNWFDNYTPRLLKLPIIDGVPQAIEQLSIDYTLVIISSTISSPIKKFLEIHKVSHFFDVVYGSDVHKSKKVKIDMILDKYEASPNDCVFITDTVGDLIEAKEKNIESLVVTWGFHNKERFSNHPPAGFIDKPIELKKKIDGYFEE